MASGNPFDRCNGNTSLVDELIGSAYPTVKHVSTNMEFVKHVSHHLPEIYKVAEAIENINFLTEAMPKVDLLLENIDQINLVYTNSEYIISIGNNINELISLNNNTHALLSAEENIEENVVLIQGFINQFGDLNEAITATETLKTETQQFRDESETFFTDTEESKDLAFKWANNPEDVEVADGAMSALHWAKKAETSASDTMKISEYNPNNKNGDVFDSINHSFDNTGSRLESENVQDALIEIASKTKLRPGAVAFPIGFDWPKGGARIAREPLSIVRRPNGSYESSFELRLVPSLITAGSGSTKRFVSSSGSNSNDGLSSGAPVATLDNALGRAAPVDIELAAGTYVNAWTIAPTYSSSHIYCRKGKARLVIGQVPSTWTAVSGGVYSADIGTTEVITVVNDAQRDEFGFPLALVRYATLAALQASGQHGFAHVGSTLYIRLRNDGSGFPVPVNGFIIVPQRGNGPIISSGNRFLLENLEIWGGDLGFAVNGATGVTGPMFVGFINCDFAYSYTNGVTMVNANGGVWFKNCRAFRNRMDGFNGHDDGASNASVWIEDHCIGLGNGFQGPSSNHQGSTNHDNGRCVRIGGLYGGGQGQSLADVGNSQSFNIGCSMTDSKLGNNPCGFHLTDNAKAWLDDCYVEDVTALKVANNSIFYLRNSLIIGNRVIENSGQILDY